MPNDSIQLDPPLHLIAGKIDCWKSETPMPVVAILCENAGAENEGPFTLSDTVELPDELLTHVQRSFPDFRLTFSKTAGGEYFANNCPECGMISGDFFLHFEPDGPFFPTSPEEAQCLTIEQIPLDYAVSVRAGFGSETAHLIVKHAKRIDRTGP